MSFFIPGKLILNICVCLNHVILPAFESKYVVRVISLFLMLFFLNFTFESFLNATQIFPLQTKKIYTYHYQMVSRKFLLYQIFSFPTCSMNFDLPFFKMTFYEYFLKKFIFAAFLNFFRILVHCDGWSMHLLIQLWIRFQFNICLAKLQSSEHRHCQFLCKHEGNNSDVVHRVYHINREDFKEQ